MTKEIWAKAHRASRSKVGEKDSCVGGRVPQAGLGPWLSDQAGSTSEIESFLWEEVFDKGCGGWGKERETTRKDEQGRRC